MNTSIEIQIFLWQLINNRKLLVFLFLVTSISIKEVNKNNVTSKEVELGGKMTLMWGAEEGTSNTMLYNAKEREREQRNKSLQSNVMSRYNSYKL